MPHLRPLPEDAERAHAWRRPTLAVLASVLGAFLGALSGACFAQSTAVEFHHAGLDHYFVTTNVSEMADLDSGVHAGWRRTGLSFPVLPAGAAGGVTGSNPVCRFYGDPGKGLDSHFYAADGTECAAVRSRFADSWRLESDEVFRVLPLAASGACAPAYQPVFRLWNARVDSNHRYTTSAAVFDAMVAANYVAEGNGTGARPAIFCVPIAASGVPDCTFTASTATPVVGSAVVLTAACTAAPTAYVWTGCSSTKATCNAAATAAGPVTYTVRATNPAGNGAVVALTLNWSNSSAGGGAKPVCALNVDNATPVAGTVATLSANCSQAPTSYRWMGCGYLLQDICTVLPSCSAAATTCKIGQSTPGYVHYALDATNAAGTTRAARDVEWVPTYQPPSAPVCTLVASDTGPLVNSQVALTAVCSGAPTSYAWSGCASTRDSCATTSTVAGSITYAVTATNAAGSGSASVAVGWVRPGPPACTLDAGTTSPTVGDTVTIAAKCSGNPTSYAWTGCSGTAASCQATGTATGSKVYTLAATNVAGTTSSSLTLTWLAPVLTPACTLTAARNTATVGELVTLTAACTKAPTSYVWSGCSGTGATCTATSNSAGSVTYAVSGRNASGTGAAATTAINWSPAGSAGDYCGSYPVVVRRDIAWGDNSRMLTAGWDDNRGFRATAVLVLAFTVPAAPQTYDVAGNTSIAEYQDPGTARHLTLSRSACDFRGTDPSGANGPFATSFGNLALVAWNVGAAPASLVPGQTYYLNIRNYSPDLGGVSCFRSTCNAAIVTNWPKRN